LLTLAFLALVGSVTAEPLGKQKYPSRSKSYISGFAGAMNGDDADELGDADFGIGFGVGGGHRRSPNLALEVDVVFDVREYDVPEGTPNPLLGSVDDLELRSSSALFSVKGIYPLSRFEPYVGAGVGLNYSELELTGSLLGIPGSFDKENDFTVAFQFVLGADFVISEKSNFGFEFRNIEVEADYGELSGGRVDIGGGLLSLVYRYHF
jgi:opacity protein-like surface antigen